MHKELVLVSSYGGGRSFVHTKTHADELSPTLKHYYKPISYEKAFKNRHNWYVCDTCLPLKVENDV